MEATRIIEKKAIDFVLKYEKKRGRKPVDVGLRGIGYDVDSGDRVIEVKGFKNVRYPSISLYKHPDELGKAKARKYYIYVVYGIESGKPRLKILPPKLIKQCIEPKESYVIRGTHYRFLEDE